MKLGWRYFPFYKLSLTPYAAVGIYSSSPNNFPISITNLGQASESFPKTMLTCLFSVF